MSNFNNTLGLRFEDGDIVLEAGAEHQVAPGLIHFAVLATMAEVAAAHAVGAPVVPANLQLNLLARATPGELRARGILIKKGRRLSVAEGEVRQDDRLVAKAVVTFAMLS